MLLGVLFVKLNSYGNFLSGKPKGVKRFVVGKGKAFSLSHTRERTERKYIYISGFPSYRYFVLKGQNGQPNTHSFAMMVIVQFRSQFGSHLKSADEAIYGQFFGNPILVVYDMQNQLPLWLVQPFNELAVAILNLRYQFRRVRSIVQRVIYDF